jgi:hypothetical protein
MRLTETGEGRVRGYLFVLRRSLRASLPSDVAQEAFREIESHVRERLEGAAPAPDELAAVEKVLGELGLPARLAQAYCSELAVDEAVASGRIGPVLRALWSLAVSTAAGFAAALVAFVGYTLGASFVAIAALKPIFPENVGLFVVGGVPRSFGALFPAPAGATVEGGYWVIPVALALGLAVLVATHRASRAFLAWWRGRGGRGPTFAAGEPRVSR